MSRDTKNEDFRDKQINTVNNKEVYNGGMLKEI